MTSAPVLDDAESQAVHLAVRLVGFAETVRLVPVSAQPGLDRTQILAALDGLARAGVARKTGALRTRFGPQILATVLRDTLASLES